MIGKLFFWKRKKKDEDEEELEETEPKKKKHKKKKKKKPPEPWGKRERLIVLSAIIFTILASGFASFRSGNLDLSNISEGKFKLPDFNIFQEETIVLYGTQNEESDPTQLINDILNRTEYLEGEYSFVVVRLHSGFRYGLNENVTFPAASLVKLPVMAAMYKAEEEDKIEFYEKYSLRASDKVEGAGVLSTKPEGYLITYQDLIQLMGKQSDNTAYKISRNLSGREMISDVMRSTEMDSTSLEENSTTADDIASFFEYLWQGDLITNDHRDQLLNNLTDTNYEDWITKGVPKTVQVAHKYGTLDNVVNDPGIVFSTDPYVLVVLSDEVSRQEADVVIPEISRMIYEFETGQN